MSNLGVESLIQRIENDVRITLIDEIKSGKAGQVITLIESCYDAIRRAIDGPDKYGRTPFSHACQSGNSDMIDALLDRPLLDGNHAILPRRNHRNHESDAESQERFRHAIAVRDTFGLLPIHYASMASNSSIVNRILNVEPSMIDAQDVEGKTPLHCAIQKSHRPMIDLLLSRGRHSLHIPMKDGKFPIHMVVKEGPHDILGMMIEYDPSIIDIPVGVIRKDIVSVETPLSIAANKLNGKVVDLLFAAGSRSLLGSDILIKMSQYYSAPQSPMLLRRIIGWGYKVHTRAEMDSTLRQYEIKNEREYRSILHPLAYHGDMTTMKIVLRCVKFSKKTHFATMMGAFTKDGVGKYDIIELLVRYGYEPWKHSSLLQSANKDIPNIERRNEIIWLLRALGCEWKPPIDAPVNPQTVSYLVDDMTEEKILEIRRRVYFEVSLMERCFDVLHPYSGN